MKINHPLLKIAQNQSGLFTSQQAIMSGIDSRNHSYHLKSGNWSRIERGIYHLNLVQTDSLRDFFLIQLWARTQNGQQVGVFSFETALYLLGIQMNDPLKFHITVPNNFYRTLPIHQSNKLILHYESLTSLEKIKTRNLHITSVRKTFQDLISTCTYPPEWIKQQLQKAIQKKITSIDELKNIPVPKRAKKIFEAILFEVID